MRRALVALALVACGGSAPVHHEPDAPREAGAEGEADRGADDAEGEPAAEGPVREALPAGPLEVLSGRASYYADSLAGNRTASGEVYDPAALTAASRDLPFGTVVRVIRPETGDSVTVRINDRGPFGDSRRILDLSRAAAEALDMIRAGVVDIRAEILERPRDAVAR